MHIDTDGTYTLQYTAVDSCGNTTVEEREVIVASPRTVLYTDGTFIINELPKDMAANIAAHGPATNVYPFFGVAAGGSAYTYTDRRQRPWDAQSSLVTAVEIGMPIKPSMTALWFSRFTNCTQMNLDNLDTSEVTAMDSMFGSCTSLRVLDLSNFNTSNVRTMLTMFWNCVFDELNITSFDTSKVTSMQGMFHGCQIDTLDISSFTSPVGGSIDATRMFEDSYIKTIIATNAFGSTVTPHAGDMADIFKNCYSLVGGAGTAFSSSHEDDWAYARIDNPPDAPGYFTARP